jgi:hypothetical protein
MKTCLLIAAIYVAFQLYPNLFQISMKLGEHKAEIERMYVVNK